MGTLGACVNGHGSGVKLARGAWAMAAALAFVLSGCSEVGYPAIHDMPAPRADTPLTPDQVKQLTDDLTSERDHLSAEVQGSAQPSPNGQPNAASNPNGNAAPQNKSSSTAQSAAGQPTITGSTQAPSAYAKP